MNPIALAAVLFAAPVPVATEPPAYLAICREVSDVLFPRGAGMRIELLAALENGALHDVELGLVKAPSPIVDRIAGLEWHFLAPDGTRGRIERFGDARLVYGWNEPEEDGEAPPIGDDESQLVLGACETPGTVYATRPLTAPRTSSPGARDEKRVREEISRAGTSRNLDVIRIGEAVIARGAVAPDRAVIENALRDYPNEMWESVEATAGPLGAFSLVHPALAEPLTIGEHTGYTVTDVMLSALVTVGGEDVAIVVYGFDSIDKGSSVDAKLILLRTGDAHVVSLAGSGC